MPCRKTSRRRSRAEEKQVSGLVPRYLLPPSSRYFDTWWGWLRCACPHHEARSQTGRAQVGDTPPRVPTSGGRDKSSTSSAVILFCFTAGTSLHTRHHLCRHGVMLASTRQLHSQSPAPIQAHRTGGITGSEGQEGANGVGGGIGVGGGNGDGNGVGGGNGDVRLWGRGRSGSGNGNGGGSEPRGAERERGRNGDGDEG